MRDARAVISEARSKHEPVVITQRGREVAVLLPVELYRELESRGPSRTMSPRLARPEDAKRFTMTVTVDRGESQGDASV